MDPFVVPTISFQLLYGLLILRHDRRRVLWMGLTAHPTTAPTNAVSCCARSCMPIEGKPPSPIKRRPHTWLLRPDCNAQKVLANR
jgi:hypothetical protein